MKNRFIVIVSLIVLILYNVSASVNSESDKVTEKRSYCATRTSHQPKIDGVLNEECWNKEGYWSDNFTQYVPNEGDKPTFQTKIKILYDYNNLYVGIYCYDTMPDKVRRILDRRDVFVGDIIGIAVDSYYDRRTASEFDLSAAGQKMDVKHSGDGKFELNWDAIWEGSSSLTDSGWTAEMRIPFSQLRYNLPDTQVWGLHFWRRIDRLKEESHWQPIKRNASAMVYQFGNLKCLDSIRSSRQIELMPYLSAGLKHKGNTDNPYIEKDVLYPKGGLDAKIGLSSNLTVDATINPDFGQIEADPSVLNLTAYETYFSERRPFFLEGSEIFDNKLGSDLLFYSRRIGAQPKYNPVTKEGEYFENEDNTTILGSVKLTGKTSHGLSIGIMNSLTDNEYGKLYSDSGSTRILTEPLTNYFAGRIRKEINAANTIYGLSYNSVYRFMSDSAIMSQLHKSAQTASLDFTQYMKNNYYYIFVKGVASDLNGSKESIKLLQESHIHRFQRPDANYLHVDSTLTSLMGTGGTIEGGKIAGKVQFGAGLTYWSPQLNYNDLGFMRVADEIEQRTWAKYAINESKGIFRTFDFNFYQTAASTFGGEISKLETGFYINTLFKNLWFSYLEVNKGFGIYDTRVLRGGPALYNNGYYGGNVLLRTNDSKDFSVTGTFACYFGVASESNTSESSFGLNYRPINKISLSGTVLYSTNFEEYQYFTTIESTTPNRYLFGQLDQQTLSFTLRAEFFLSPRISFQYYGSPFLTMGKYSSFKKVNEASSKDPSIRFTNFTESEVTYNSTDNTYQVNEPNEDPYIFKNPDFTFGQFRSNFVFRWEYHLGSVIYLVWSHDQTHKEQIYTPSFNTIISDLFSQPSGDIIMIKISYWFSM
jgi:hypothetical protein